MKRVIIVGIGMKHIVHNFKMNENIFGVSEQMSKWAINVMHCCERS